MLTGTDMSNEIRLQDRTRVHQYCLHNKMDNVKIYWASYDNHGTSNYYNNNKETDDNTNNNSGDRTPNWNNSHSAIDNNNSAYSWNSRLLGI